jgi:hypothetical protein
MSDNPRNHASFSLPEEEKKARLDAMRGKLEASLPKANKPTKSAGFSRKGIRLLVYVFLIAMAYFLYFRLIDSYG